MSNSTIKILGGPKENFFLRHINEGDLEDLRKWKNHYRDSFFLKTEITPEQQQNWYRGFLERENDMMFVCVEKSSGTVFGCMGYRLIEDDTIVDAYNIMRFVRTEDTTYSMADVFTTMLRYVDVHYSLPIEVKVLKSNVALDWYYNNGFEYHDDHDSFVVLRWKGEKTEQVKI